MQEEFDSLIKNETWVLTTLPPGRSAIQNRWVFKIKDGVDCESQRFKARLVTKGFTQRPGLDYQETFSPVGKYDSLRTVLSIAASRDLEILKLDIKTAILYGELQEELYLHQPKGFVIEGRETEVCLLKKSLYGLKQASRIWNKKFDLFLLKFGLKPSSADPCIYFREEKGEFTIVAIWVDDGHICSNTQETYDKIVQHLSTNFEMRSGPAKHFLGLKIDRDRMERRLYVSQSQYIRKILDMKDST